MTVRTRTTNADSITLRAAPRATCDDPAVDRYVDLVIAIFKRAKSDLHHPGYAAGAQQWLRSPQAAWYAGLLGIDAAHTRQRLAQDA